MFLDLIKFLHIYFQFPQAKECSEELKLDREGQLGCLKDFTMLREEIEAKRAKMAGTRTFIELQKSLVSLFNFYSIFL